MEILTDIEGNKAIISLEGKLTVSTSPSLSSTVENLPDNICDIDIDLSKVDYVASAGLRILVAIEKFASKRGGTSRLLYPCKEVSEILEMTGLSEVLNVED